MERGLPGAPCRGKRPAWGAAFVHDRIERGWKISFAPGLRDQVCRDALRFRVPPRRDQRRTVAAEVTPRHARLIARGASHSLAFLLEQCSESFALTRFKSFDVYELRNVLIHALLLNRGREPHCVFEECLNGAPPAR